MVLKHALLDVTAIHVHDVLTWMYESLSGDYTKTTGAGKWLNDSAYMLVWSVIGRLTVRACIPFALTMLTIHLQFIHILQYGRLRTQVQQEDSGGHLIIKRKTAICWIHYVHLSKGTIFISKLWYIPISHENVEHVAMTNPNKTWAEMDDRFLSNSCIICRPVPITTVES